MLLLIRHKYNVLVLLVLLGILTEREGKDSSGVIHSSGYSSTALVLLYKIGSMHSVWYTYSTA